MRPVSKINSWQPISICCAFKELAKEIDKDWVELYWFELEINKKMCNNCKEYWSYEPNQTNKIQRRTRLSGI